jgi:hypothetical protein
MDLMVRIFPPDYLKLSANTTRVTQRIVYVTSKIIVVSFQALVFAIGFEPARIALALLRLSIAMANSVLLNFVGSNRGGT